MVKQTAANSAVKDFIQAGIIERSPSQNTNFLTTFFTVQEPNKRRPVLDCQNLNKFIQCEHFKMEGIPALRGLVKPGDSIYKRDLKNAYVVVPIHPDSRDFLSFRNQRVIYRYCSLPFGLSSAPRIFSKIIKYAMEPLTKAGIRLVYYLDGICSLAKSKMEMNQFLRKC